MQLITQATSNQDNGPTNNRFVSNSTEISCTLITCESIKKLIYLRLTTQNQTNYPNLKI